MEQAGVRALRQIGTVAAVEPLLELTRGLTLPSSLKHAAREAIQVIQGSLDDVEEGGLSLADASSPAGRLSVAAEDELRGGLPSRGDKEVE
ncbi:unnamed protein product [marine sediment metagenome]|uniref:Uncharacterized protein n=1 Tax=marine sediment metagenome TaxID=412755 RepID=X0X669_9ZZZZ